MNWQDRVSAHLQQTDGHISLDTRHLHAGDVFIALPGQCSDGRNYLQQALSISTVLVLAEAQHAEHFAQWRDHTAIVWVPELRSQLGSFLQRYYASPERHALQVLGVTGTNGKTSVSHFLAQALSTQATCGVLGTIGQGLWPQLQPTVNTTSDVVHNHQWMAEFAEQGAQFAVMEVSSHALDQGRVDGVKYRIALFTNLSHDHLDYHGSMENYFAAKQQLFTPDRAEQVAVCIDDAWGQQLATVRPDALTVSGECGALAAVAPVRATLRSTGIDAQWQTPWGVIATNSAIVGRFNLANMGLVIASLGLLGWSPAGITQAMSELTPVLGRMQCVTLANQRLVIIDYAHTPDALAKALCAAREHTQGQLFCVFGCGGDRDRAKRAPMGHIAETWADGVWLTSDNNRSEPFADISAEVLAGVRRPEWVSIVSNRAEAIAQALSAMQPGDVTLIAGKGHEQYQEERGERYPFSDLAVVQSLQEVSL